VFRRKRKFCMSRALFTLLAWTAVFGVNLIVPYPIGLAATAGGGRIGMNIGVIVLWAAGAAAVYRFRALSLTLPLGGLLVALAQFIPALQWCAAATGGVVATSLGFDSPDALGPPAWTEAGGFVATIVTGGLLNLAAVVLAFPALAVGIEETKDERPEPVAPSGQSP
jgi:hypothetical protein